jgi:hypothetical protein
VICFSAADLAPSPHHPSKPQVSFASLPSPSFSSRGELFVVVASYDESSGELLSLRHRESTMDHNPTFSPLLCELGSPILPLKNKSYIQFNSMSFTLKTLCSLQIVS